MAVLLRRNVERSSDDDRLVYRIMREIVFHFTPISRVHRGAIRTPEQLGNLEQFHATLKREEIHSNTYQRRDDARAKVKDFQNRYNNLRPHWALRLGAKEDPYTASDVYVQG